MSYRFPTFHYQLLDGQIQLSLSIYYYETGIKFIPSYDLNMSYSDSHSNPPDLEASGTAAGIFAGAGMSFNITKFLSFNTQAICSFIPIDLTYENNDVTLENHSNLGGIMLKFALAFKF